MDCFYHTRCGNNSLSSTVLLLCECLVCICHDCARKETLICLSLERQRRKVQPDNNEASLAPYDAYFSCPQCAFKVTTNQHSVIHGVDQALEAQERLIRAAMTEVGKSYFKYTTNLLDLQECYKLLHLQNDLTQTKADPTQENQTVNIAHLRHAIAALALSYYEGYDDPTKFLTFTENRLYHYYIADNKDEYSSRCIACLDAIQPGFSVQLTCACKYQLCRTCVLINVHIRPETYHNGVHCVLCKQPSRGILRNTKYVAACEHALIQSALQYSSKVLTIKDSRSTDSERINLLAMIKLYWCIGYEGNLDILSEKERDTATLPRLRLEVAKLEEFRLNRLGTIDTYSIHYGSKNGSNSDGTGNNKRDTRGILLDTINASESPAGRFPIGFLHALQVTKNAFFEHYFIPHTTGTPITTSDAAALCKTPDFSTRCSAILPQLEHVRDSTAPSLHLLDSLVLLSIQDTERNIKHTTNITPLYYTIDRIVQLLAQYVQSKFTEFDVKLIKSEDNSLFMANILKKLSGKAIIEKSIRTLVTLKLFKLNTKVPTEYALDWQRYLQLQFDPLLANDADVEDCATMNVMKKVKTVSSVPEVRVVASSHKSSASGSSHATNATYSDTSTLDSNNNSLGGAVRRTSTIAPAEVIIASNAIITLSTSNSSSYSTSTRTTTNIPLSVHTSALPATTRTPGTSAARDVPRVVCADIITTGSGVKVTSTISKAATVPSTSSTFSAVVNLPAAGSTMHNPVSLVTNQRVKRTKAPPAEMPLHFPSTSEHARQIQTSAPASANVTTAGTSISDDGTSVVPVTSARATYSSSNEAKDSTVSVCTPNGCMRPANDSAEDPKGINSTRNAIGQGPITGSARKGRFMQGHKSKSTSSIEDGTVVFQNKVPKWGRRAVANVPVVNTTTIRPSMSSWVNAAAKNPIPSSRAIHPDILPRVRAAKKDSSASSNNTTTMIDLSTAIDPSISSNRISVEPASSVASNDGTKDSTVSVYNLYTNRGIGEKLIGEGSTEASASFYKPIKKRQIAEVYNVDSDSGDDQCRFIPNHTVNTGDNASASRTGAKEGVLTVATIDLTSAIIPDTTPAVRPPVTKSCALNPGIDITPAIRPATIGNHSTTMIDLTTSVDLSQPLFTTEIEPSVATSYVHVEPSVVDWTTATYNDIRAKWTGRARPTPTTISTTEARNQRSITQPTVQDLAMDTGRTVLIANGTNKSAALMAEHQWLWEAIVKGDAPMNLSTALLLLANQVGEIRMMRQQQVVLLKNQAERIVSTTSKVELISSIERLGPLVAHSEAIIAIKAMLAASSDEQVVHTLSTGVPIHDYNNSSSNSSSSSSSSSSSRSRHDSNAFNRSGDSNGNVLGSSSPIIAPSQPRMVIGSEQVTNSLTPAKKNSSDRTSMPTADTADNKATTTPFMLPPTLSPSSDSMSNSVNCKSTPPVRAVNAATAWFTSELTASVNSKATDNTLSALPASYSNNATHSTSTTVVGITLPASITAHSDLLATVSTATTISAVDSTPTVADALLGDFPRDISPTLAAGYRKMALSTALEIAALGVPYNRKKQPLLAAQHDKAEEIIAGSSDSALFRAIAKLKTESICREFIASLLAARVAQWPSRIEETNKMNHRTVGAALSIDDFTWSDSEEVNTATATIDNIVTTEEDISTEPVQPLAPTGILSRFSNAEDVRLRFNLWFEKTWNPDKLHFAPLKRRVPLTHAQALAYVQTAKSVKQTFGQQWLPGIRHAEEILASALDERTAIAFGHLLFVARKKESSPQPRIGTNALQNRRKYWERLCTDQKRFAYILRTGQDPDNEMFDGYFSDLTVTPTPQRSYKRLYQRGNLVSCPVLSENIHWDCDHSEWIEACATVSSLKRKAETQSWKNYFLFRTRCVSDPVTLAKKEVSLKIAIKLLVQGKIVLCPDNRGTFLLRERALEVLVSASSTLLEAELTRYCGKNICKEYLTYRRSVSSDYGKNLTSFGNASRFAFWSGVEMPQDLFEEKLFAEWYRMEGAALSYTPSKSTPVTGTTSAASRKMQKENPPRVTNNFGMFDVASGEVHMSLAEAIKVVTQLAPVSQCTNPYWLAVVRCAEKLIVYAHDTNVDSDDERSSVGIASSAGRTKRLAPAMFTKEYFRRIRRKYSVSTICVSDSSADEAEMRDDESGAVEDNTSFYSVAAGAVEAAVPEASTNDDISDGVMLRRSEITLPLPETTSSTNCVPLALSSAPSIPCMVGSLRPSAPPLLVPVGSERWPPQPTTTFLSVTPLSPQPLLPTARTVVPPPPKQYGSTVPRIVGIYPIIRKTANDASTNATTIRPNEKLSTMKEMKDELASWQALAESAMADAAAARAERQLLLNEIAFEKDAVEEECTEIENYREVRDAFLENRRLLKECSVAVPRAHYTHASEIWDLERNIHDMEKYGRDMVDWKEQLQKKVEMQDNLLHGALRTQKILKAQVHQFETNRHAYKKKMTQRTTQREEVEVTHSTELAAKDVIIQQLQTDLERARMDTDANPNLYQNISKNQAILDGENANISERLSTLQGQFAEQVERKVKLEGKLKQTWKEIYLEREAYASNVVEISELHEDKQDLSAYFVRKEEQHQATTEQNNRAMQDLLDSFKS